MIRELIQYVDCHCSVEAWTEQTQAKSSHSQHGSDNEGDPPIDSDPSPVSPRQPDGPPFFLTDRQLSRSVDFDFIGFDTLSPGRYQQYGLKYMDTGY